METSTNRRNPVRRLHSRNRQKEYVTPSARDVLCPFFKGRFIKTGQADVTDDFYGQCHDNTDSVVCAYKERLTADVSLCKRYWKEDPLNMEHLYTVAPPSSTAWQQLDVQFDYERPFANRTADVQLALIREIVTPIDLGDFLTQWKQWYDNQPGNWIQQTHSSGRKEILNTINQSGRSFWYNPVHIDAKDYTHEYFVQARAGDDDMYGSVFRYNPSEKSFYTFEWDSGGLDIKGMGVYRNTYVGGSLQRVRLAHSPIRWGAGYSYIHHISVSVVKNRIKVVVKRQNGASLIHLATLEFLDTHPDAPMKGAWGPMTNSQPSTYFWDLNYKGTTLIDSTVDLRLSPTIPLSYVKKDGALHLVSKPMKEIFSQEVIDEAAIKAGVNPSAITSHEYWLTGTNVLEGVMFSQYDFIDTISSSPDTRIAMTTFDYDGAILPFTDLTTITNRNVPVFISDTSMINRSLTRVIIKASERRLFDRIALQVNGKTVRHIPNITANEYVFDFKDWIHLDKGDVVTVRYVPNPFEMEYYRGDYVDTHDKIFKIEGNVLGWHHVPVYETEES